MSIERKSIIMGAVYEVWVEDNCIASFNSYCDAVDFVRFFAEL